jgi:hypothetical protein
MARPPHPRLRSARQVVAFRRGREGFVRVAAVAFAVVAVVLAFGAARADAFGTYNGILSQNAEHERITRVLQCGNRVQVPDCMQDATMTATAGGRGILGAVGEPDHPVELYAYEFAHCDGGDYFDVSWYAQSLEEANARLQECAFVVMQRLNAAVAAAGNLTDAQGRLRFNQASIANCSYPAAVTSSAESAKTAKCQVLNQFGRAMHAVEDFWSHSNWADRAEFGTISLQNPRGLLQTSIPDFLRYSASAGVANADQLQIPDGLISGCDDSSPAEFIARNCGKPGTMSERVKHSDLNKDKGLINPSTGEVSSPKTDRAKIGENFRLAVTGARAHVAQTWADLTAAIRARYPGARGETIVRALSSDTPWTRCTQTGPAPAATQPPVGPQSSTRSVTAAIRNRTGSALGCGTLWLRAGEWANLPPDEIAPGGSGSFRAQSDVSTTGPATDGYARFAIGTTGYLVHIAWDNPLIGSNKYECRFLRTDGAASPTAPFSCNRSGGSGNDANPEFTITSRSRGGEPAPLVRTRGDAVRGETAPPDGGGGGGGDRPDPLVLGEEKVDDCGGYARNFGLHVDGERCRQAFERIGRTVARDEVCPDGWDPRRNVRIEGYNDEGDRGEELPPLVMCSEEPDGDGEPERYAFQILAH